MDKLGVGICGGSSERTNWQKETLDIIWGPTSELCFRLVLLQKIPSK